MAHTVLARKWRPKKFIDLVGQKSTVTILQNIISSNRLHHAYLLTGTRGVGKTTIARIIAKALNCLNLEQNEPCGKCENCLQIDNGRFVDVIEIDAASNTGVDNIREVLENAQYAPTSGKYKIYIIDEVHMLSKSAFNAMLKTLEEPPAHVVFILATTDPQKVPITVLSRCLQLKLRNLLPDEIASHLVHVLTQEKYTYEADAVAKLGDAAQGSMRDALSLTDQAIAFGNGNISVDVVQQMLGISDDNNIIALLNSVTTNNSNEIVNICQRLNSEGANLENILEQINNALFNIGLAQLSHQPQMKHAYQELAQKISLQDCQLYFEISNVGLEQIRKVNNKYPILTMTLLRMVAFTIGSSEYKQIIIENNNCHTTIVNNESIIQSDVSLNERSIDPQIINNAHQIPNDIISINKEYVDESLNTPPWESNVIIDNDIPVTKAESLDNMAVSNIDSTTHLNLSDSILEIQNTDSIDIEPPLEHIAKKNNSVFTSWLDFVKTLDISSISSQVAVVINNAAQISNNINNNELNLQISDTYRRWVDGNCVDYIENLLFETYQQHFDLSFEFTVNVNNQGSKKEFDKLQSEQRQQDAENAIMSDPIINDLIKNFSAKIIQITPNE